MPLVFPDENYCQAVLRFTSTVTDSGVAILTLGLHKASGAPLSAAAVAVFGSFDDNVMPEMSNDYTLAEVECFNETETGSASGAVQGGSAGAQTPPNVAVLAEKRTSTRGPRARGRWFLPGFIPEGEVNEAGIIDPASVARMQGNMSDFVAGVLLGGDVEELVIIQGSEGQSPPLDPPPVVNGLFIDNKVATQRGRLR
jgi:hypothetical protein